MHSLLNLLIWLLLLAIATGSGYVLYRVLRVPASPRLDTAVISLAFGLGLLICGVAVLGWVHQFQLIPTWVAIVAIVATRGGWQAWHSRNEFASSSASLVEPPVYPIWGINLALGMFGVIYLLSTMAPPLEGDTLHSYLDVPRQYLDAGGIIPLPYEVHAALPRNVQMLSVLSLALAGNELAQMLAGFTMAAGGAITILVLGRRYLSDEMGRLAALIYATTYVVLYLVPTTKLNLGWAFFDLLAVYTICRWAFDSVRNDRWLLAAGILSGLALGTQYQAGYTALLLGSATIAVSWHQRSSFGSLIRRLISYGLPVLLLGTPWMVQNYLEVGNPVYPVLNSVFGLPEVELAEQTSGLLGLLTVPWQMATGYIAGKFGKPVGPLLLGALPGLLLVRPLNRKVKLGLLFVGALYLMWYVGVQRPRNFLTGLGVLSLISAYVYVELGRRSRLVRNTCLVLFVSFLLFNGAIFVHNHFVSASRLSYILGAESRDAFLDRLLPLYPGYPNKPMIDYINTQLPTEARIVAMYLGTGYYVRRPFIDSRMVDGNFTLDTAKDASDLVHQWLMAGVTHVFISDSYMAQYTAGNDPTSWLTDYIVVRDPDFRRRCLQEVFAALDQRLYQLTCSD